MREGAWDMMEPVDRVSAGGRSCAVKGGQAMLLVVKRSKRRSSCAWVEVNSFGYSEDAAGAVTSQSVVPHDSPT